VRDPFQVEATADCIPVARPAVARPPTRPRQLACGPRT